MRYEFRLHSQKGDPAMKNLWLAVVALGLIGCATAEQREATRQMQANCQQQGRVVYHQGSNWHCISPEQAVALQREQARQQALQQQRNHEKEVACIRAGGTWASWSNSCQARLYTPPAEVRIVQ